MSEQSIAEILSKVQRLQIVARRAVNDLFAGQYQSAFRGRGMEFDEVREYQPGDDVRTIDWNVTARAGVPFIKRFAEERELTVYFLVDVSASGAFGSGDRSKLELAIEVAALLMFSALKNNDKVGLMTFCDDIVDFYPPRKGKSNVLRLVRELVAARPVPRETRLDRALEYLVRVQKRRCVAFVLSDFITTEHRTALAVAHQRHDVIAVSVSDPRELALPDVGFLNLRDAETGEIIEVDTSHAQVRALFESGAAERGRSRGELLKKIGIDELEVRTDEDYLTSLRRFFRMRERRYR